MLWVLSYSSSCGLEYWEKYLSIDEARRKMTDDAHGTAQLHEEAGFEVTFAAEEEDHIDIYVSHTDIYDEWRIQSLDEFCEMKWEELEVVPFDEDDDGRLVLATDWFEFCVGDEREDVIWRWFDKNHSKGVGWLVNEYESEKFAMWLEENM